MGRKKKTERKSPFGKTKQYPEGKLREDDEGEIKFGITHHQGEVILDFGTPVIWLGMPPELARIVAKNLIKHADAIEQNVNDEAN